MWREIRNWPTWVPNEPICESDFKMTIVDNKKIWKNLSNWFQLSVLALVVIVIAPLIINK
jgi:hypothetical protein